MQIGMTALAALVLFGLFFGALSLGRLFGRVRKRRCACAEAHAVMKLVEERKSAARKAERYRPETVDPTALPILPETLSGQNTERNQ